MKPNDTILGILATICVRLVNTGRLESESAKEARDYYIEWGNLSARYAVAGSAKELTGPMEAQSTALGINMAKFIEKHLAV
jgi:hypothetical protein